MEWQLYTDGSWSSGGSGGWAYILDHQTSRSFHSGAERMRDNNEAELMAVIKGLEAIVAKGNEFPATRVKIHCDSHAVRTDMRRALNGERWGKGIRDDVRARFRVLVSALRPRFAHMHPMPEEHRRCDSMARRARLALKAKLERSVLA